jgi:predicted histone-like DNA-binding protein
MPVLYKTYQNTNTESKNYGMYYGRVVTTKTMTYQELCKHMSEHNSIYGEDVCLGVANKLQTCMLEQLLEGKKVQFGELGTFYLSVKSSGVDTEDDYNVGVNVKGLYLRFAPNRTDVNNLSSKMLKKKAEFMNAKDLITPKTKPGNGEGGDTPGGDNNG